ncbi:MAG TPA: 2-amino-4-hydroxy-6-hydroxymethyldihydropteridine diphosphokinase [Steroidobacteraceae bacterium]|nr:2-amino-4-hydroxy-6-hydroxymethyldihydropteridine diphosphokinase [Steroidobacteraceae bacterium]
MARVFVAGGSNVEPEKHLELASSELRREFPGLRCSAWYRNRAAGFEGADFINFAAELTTDLPVRALLQKLHAVEARCGRPREAPRWAPRTMDLDVLLYDDLVCDEPGLKLPRPDLLKRAYMLGPLAEIAPHLRHPTAGLTIGELWERFDRDAHPLQRVRPPS